MKQNRNIVSQVGQIARTYCRCAFGLKSAHPPFIQQLCRFLFYFLLLSVLKIHAEEPQIPRLPDLAIFKYQPCKRDPFISSEASRTLVTGENNIDHSISSRVVTRYVQTIVEVIQRELFIEGLSTGDEQGHAIAIINGVTFNQGDRIPLPVPARELVQLDELARTYGLPLHTNPSQLNSIFVEVGHVKPEGVEIVLPGFKVPLCELKYQGDNVPNAIQLERKKPSQ
jgi:hypothetical protein